MRMDVYPQLEHYDTYLLIIVILLEIGYIATGILVAKSRH